MGTTLNKTFTVTRKYLVKVPKHVVEEIERDYPDTNVEAELIDTATRYADAGDLTGSLCLYRNAERTLCWDIDPDMEPYLMTADYEVEEVDYDYEDYSVEVEHTCGHCNTVNVIAEGTDPGEYRCTKCIEWM